MGASVELVHDHEVDSLLRRLVAEELLLQVEDPVLGQVRPEADGAPEVGFFVFFKSLSVLFLSFSFLKLVPALAGRPKI